MLNFILFGISVNVLFKEVTDAKLTAGKEINAGSNDDFKQSQLERMLKPAIARVKFAPVFLAMILLPALLQGIS